MKHDGHERLYRVKPFARSYLTRILKLVPADAEHIRTRYRALAAAYQEERGGENHNRYDAKVFTVRSPSEALSVRRLRHASSLAIRSKFDDANKILVEAQITSPEYFEVYRTSAFVYYRQGDILSAMAEYEAAFDLVKIGRASCRARVCQSV